MWEPTGIAFNEQSNSFSRFYTFNDAVIDGVKYFKFYYPFLEEPTDIPIDYKDKKFCTLIARNWESSRMKMLDFFSKKQEREFEFYGSFPGSKYQKMYKGAIAGNHRSKEKRDVLKQYRFCICFENSTIPGYISEKIFACFASGCIPVYLGAPNILKYIPEDCFIDYRIFKNDEELYQYLKNMPESDYEEYLRNIFKFIKSDKAAFFSPNYFKKLIEEL